MKETGWDLLCSTRTTKKFVVSKTDSPRHHPPLSKGAWCSGIISTPRQHHFYCTCWHSRDCWEGIGAEVVEFSKRVLKQMAGCGWWIPLPMSQAEGGDYSYSTTASPCWRYLKSKVLISRRTKVRSLLFNPQGANRSKSEEKAVWQWISAEICMGNGWWNLP